MGFEVHPQLAADCHLMGRFASAQVLLHRNSQVPWYIVVPEANVRELHELRGSPRQDLDDLLNRLACFVKTHHQCEHTNVAAIGNRVPQLHIHVVGRWEGDPCWPDVVWGNLPEGPERSGDELERLQAELGRYLRYE